jgi:class 3 adenylate cyclase/2-polyprenyl-3-methyl-5-hydroxy-6-metoxy-1,4-benzoquinol methylase
MKNMYRVTRPAWADKERMETVVIFVASFALAIYAAGGEWIAGSALAYFHLPTNGLNYVWPIIDLIVVTFGCLWLIQFYKKRSICCYPSTFLYAFNMPEASNPSGKSKVLGYIHIKPDMKRGNLIVEGTSFIWEDGSLGQRTGFTSSVTLGTEENNETVCHIHIDINEADRSTRHYSHGILQFQTVLDSTGSATHDAYAGYLESYKKQGELQNLVVRARGYAERYRSGIVPESDIQPVLQRIGNFLFAKFDAISGGPTLPALWTANPLISSEKANIWKHDIPTPQAAILNETLQPYIEKYLRGVLQLFGLDNSAIAKFQSLVIKKAKAEDTLVGYERELKAGLIGQPRRKEDKALNQRAEIIYSEIKQFFSGESLLDIGCGNGLISSLAKKHFSHIQLLDVVEYVPKALNLAFTPYIEGQPFPIKDPFDTVILIAVLHHSLAPVELLKLAWGATKQRLIIIESVVGVHNVLPSVKYDLVELSNQDQIAFAAFVDWFYNRVLHNDVPVPYNFTTIENWQATFLQHNMRLTQTIHLGQDIEIGPEYHVLFVLEKESSPRNLPKVSDSDVITASLVSGINSKKFQSWAGGERVTLAIVFTDIVGSTSMGQELRDAGMNAVRQAHFDRCRNRISHLKGYEIKTLGDGIMVAFKSTDAALDYAIDLQSNTGHPLVKIRAGIHIGSVLVEEEDVFGGPVNFAARVVGTIKEAEIWLSNEAKLDISQLGAERHRHLRWQCHEGNILRGFPGTFTLWSLKE